MSFTLITIANKAIPRLSFFIFDPHTLLMNIEQLENERNTKKKKKKLHMKCNAYL